MRRTIKVFLGETPRVVGALRYDADGARESAAFEYDPTWLAATDRFPLDPSLPLVAGPQFHKKTRDGSIFHAAIADTEPDGWGRRVILRDHAKRRQAARTTGQTGDARPLSNLDMLLAVDDVSRIGALRFRGRAVLPHPEAESPGDCARRRARRLRLARGRTPARHDRRGAGPVQRRVRA